MPKNAASRTVRPLDALMLRPAAEVVLAAGAPLEDEPLAPVAALVEGVVSVGRPKPVNELPRGPGAADADAPTPTKKPTLCCFFKKNLGQYSLNGNKHQTVNLKKFDVQEEHPGTSERRL